MRRTFSFHECRILFTKNKKEETKMKRKKIRSGDGAGLLTVPKKISVGEMARLCEIRGYVLTAVFAFMLSTVRGPAGSYPLSFAVLAASSGGVCTALCFVGAVLGTVVMDAGALWHILILLSMLLVRLWVCVFKGDFKVKNHLFRRLFRERGYIKVTVAALGAAGAGVVAIIESESIYYGLFSALMGIGGAAVATAAFIFFSDVASSRSKRIAGLFVLALGLFSAVSAIRLPFSLCAVLAFLSSLYFSYAGGSEVGAVVGLAGGLAVGGQYAPAFALAGLLFSMLWEYSKVISVIACGAVASVVSLFSGGLSAVSDVIPEIALGAAIAAPFASLGPLPGPLPRFLDFDKREMVEVGKEEKRLPKMGEALESLSLMIKEAGERFRLPTKEEAERCCSAAREKFCKGCVHERECTGREARVVDSMFYNMAFRLCQSGRITAKIVPESVARRCFNIDPIIEAVNSGAKKARVLSEGAKRSELFSADYSAVACLMRELSETEAAIRDEEGEKSLLRELSAEGLMFSHSSVWGKRKRRVYLRGVDFSSRSAGENDIRLCAEKALSQRLSSPEFSIEGGSVSASMHSVPAISLSAGRYALKSKRDSQSGDSVSTFENDEGYFYTLVSDGMGSGREAAQASGICAAFLEKLLSAGCPMRSALELLNCYIRGAAGECFATVDLMEADLYTKRARFIKSGAAPTFIIRGGRIYRIHSKTVPVGIMRALDAEAVSFELRAGDTVIMMSDGVTGSYEESPWLYDLLSEGIKDIGSPSVLARLVAEAAAENTGREDDITVCAIVVEEG